MRTIRNALILNIVLVIPFLSLKAQDIFKIESNLFSTRELFAETRADSHSKITIKSALTLRGEITITTSEKEEVKVSFYKKAKADSKSKAIDFIDLIALGLEQVPKGINLVLRAPNPAPWQGMEMGLIEVEMVVPEFCEIVIDAAYYDINAEGPFKKFIVPSSLSRFDVDNVTEQLDLTTSNRRVQVRNISGDISVSTSNSTLIARDINSPHDKVSFRNDGGDIKISDVTGSLSVKNSYGRIDIDKFKPTGGRSYIRGFNGPIIVSITSMSDGYLLVNNRYEDIEITVPFDISAAFSLAVEEGGKIEVSNFPFKTDLVQQNRLNLITGDGDATINSSIRGKGNIYVRSTEKGDSF